MVNHGNLASYWPFVKTKASITLDYVRQKQGFVKPPGDLMTADLLSDVLAEPICRRLQSRAWTPLKGPLQPTD